MMKRLALHITAAIFVILSAAFIDDAAFLRDQKKYSHVKQAYADKETLLAQKLKLMNVSLKKINILITAFKTEQELTVYVKTPGEAKYKKFGTYNICSMSGILGPKRRSGDRQVPEGFYHINRLNPTSNYYLSLGIDYPNQADQIRSSGTNSGGDIFIHGKCVTIGCMPLTDDYIKEVYLLALQAYQSGQHHIPVYIFPYKFNSVSASQFSAPYAGDQHTIAFWKNLKKGYDQFLAKQQELPVKVNASGDYVF